MQMAMGVGKIEGENEGESVGEYGVSHPGWQEEGSRKGEEEKKWVEM